MTIFFLTQILVITISFRRSDGQYLNVEKCPTDIESHERREKEFVCTDGKRFHCMPTTNGTFVEFCMDLLALAKEDGCPVVKSLSGNQPEIVQTCSSFNEDMCMLDGIFLTNTLYKYESCLPFHMDFTILGKNTEYSNPISQSTFQRTSILYRQDIYSSATALRTSRKNEISGETEEVSFTNDITTLPEEGTADSSYVNVALVASVVGALLVSSFTRFIIQFLIIERPRSILSAGNEVPVQEIYAVDTEVVIEMEDDDIYNEIIRKNETENVHDIIFDGSFSDASDDDTFVDKCANEDDQRTNDNIHNQTISTNNEGTIESIDESMV